jgi:hypothetical protein
VVSPTDIAGKVFEIFTSLDSKQKALIEVTNDTGFTLKRLSDDHSSGGFATLPEDEIPAGGKDAFVSHDTGFLRGAVGEVTYGVFPEGAEAPQGRWTITWSIPEVGDSTCGGSMADLDPSKFVERHRIGSGKETEAKFELEGPGGGGKKEPGKGAGPDLKSTVMIEVKNNTDQTLVLVDQGHDHGGFVTLPAAQIAPGGEDSFASFETDRAEPGSKGFLKYAVGTAGTEWTIGWDNPENADNTSESTLEGAEAHLFTALDQIGAGEENVPAVYTISRGGGGPVVTETNNSVEITIVNQSNQVLRILDHGAFSGQLVGEPAEEIPVGGSTTFFSTEADGSQDTGCQGFARYHAGDPNALLWTVQWNNPDEGENSSSGTLEGSDAELFSAEDGIAAEKENAAAVFTLSGGPDIEEPVFAPPVEVDEPTLRRGDESVDGWVEYLQQLLNDRGLGPVAVDGDFGAGTHQAVIAFQTNFRDQAGGKLLVDGVVGHQTWAALREEDPRPPSTDGREPHSHVEAWPEARWFTEDSAVHYRPEDDLLFLVAVNTGDQELLPGQFEATARLTFPSGETSVFTVPLFTDNGSTVPPGQTFFFGGHDLRQQVEPGTYEIEAYMPAELGGDQTTETFLIP